MVVLGMESSHFQSKQVVMFEIRVDVPMQSLNLLFNGSIIAHAHCGRTWI